MSGGPSGQAVLFPPGALGVADMKASEQSKVRTWAFTLLRVAVGWHLLYEGVVKLAAKNWTSAEYLRDATWMFADTFRRLADSPEMLRVVDLLNVWGLTLIGLALVLGFLTRLSAGLGAVLIALYYLANPPFIGLQGMAGEGSYLIVNKNLVEIVCLVVLLLLPRTWMYGIDHLLAAFRGRRKLAADTGAGGPAQAPCTVSEDVPPPRRQLLKHLVGLPILGAFGFSVYQKREYDSLEEKYLIEAGADGRTSATLKSFSFSRLSELKGTMSFGRIGNLKVSRVILGGNLVGGWAHARDLLYVSDLVMAYHSDERVINTFRLAEKCGINTFLTHPKLLRIVRKYWHAYGGRIQFISDCGGADLHEAVRLSIDGGAHACYVQGGTADRLVEEGRFDEIRRALDTIRSHGLPAGIGGHRIKTVRGCVEEGIRPDFWMKTLHHHNYWSARPGEKDNDNNFCLEPDETIALMKTLDEPWIAFKVLAAGAIRPQDGFKYAFESGADFICVGMYDFQIVQDVNIAAEALANTAKRSRPWRG